MYSHKDKSHDSEANCVHEINVASPFHFKFTSPSPDEVALLTACAQIGIVMSSRSSSTIQLKDISGTVENYEVLQFNKLSLLMNVKRNLKKEKRSTQAVDFKEKQ